MQEDQKNQYSRNDTKFHVLFVCTGNSCRSPIAEGILKKLIPNNYRDKIKVESAGTGGFVGMPATEFSIEVSMENGIDISHHKSKGISETLLRRADLILVMSREHERFIRYHFPRYRDNVFLLKNFNLNSKKLFRKESIQDPIGRDKSYYEKIYNEIEVEVKRILPRILRLAEKKIDKFNPSIRNSGDKV